MHNALLSMPPPSPYWWPYTLQDRGTVIIIVTLTTYACHRFGSCNALRRKSVIDHPDGEEAHAQKTKRNALKFAYLLSRKREPSIPSRTTKLYAVDPDVKRT
ncbi:hypothetical protein BD410DRAFT_130996 [Rickenella mellea]|uniref:Uncharacterized protein n=1 Tax=Rickenella mellea TaxID=50990 RepID=A0A4Y7Q8J1_9AGAM|nr:hypothetical protein BD410DRAFT_130996 [Rickenella mellea]